LLIGGPRFESAFLDDLHQRLDTRAYILEHAVIHGLSNHGIARRAK
jgi:hypothetical protein